RMLNLSSFVALQLASFILIPFFLLSAYCLVSYFFEEKNKRKICFIFFVFASGLGWLLSTFVNKVLSIDVTTFTPYILFGAPHMIASLTLIILIFLFSLYTFDKYKIIYSLWAGFCAFLLFSFHPYHVCTIFGVLGAFLVVEFLIDKKIYFEHIVHYIILLIFSAPPIIYYLWCFLNIPVYYQTLFLQNVTLTPALWIVLADFSALLILAILGIISLVKEKNINRKNIFLIVWVITQFFLIYLPINTNRRLLEGLSIPITILAVYGIFFLENWLKNNSKSLYKLYCLSSFSLFVYIFCLSIFFIFTIDLSFFEYNPTLAYLKKDNENTMIWLKENTPEQSVVLSSYENGNIIPVIASRPVYYGHWSGTVRASEKSILSYNFFKKDDDQERRIFLETNS
ncbi:MAG: hypothetical protein NT094_02630, partial [Candidatus Staskawiczbacteria bacterium]|nr:hypothetical protein [Candidatus Staskawiczbacteria bacterium]